MAKLTSGDSLLLGKPIKMPEEKSRADSNRQSFARCIERMDEPAKNKRRKKHATAGKNYRKRRAAGDDRDLGKRASKSR